MSMIDALIEGLGGGEEITCRVRRTDQGQVQLIFQPTLDGGDENGPGGRDDTERQVREALARPVKFTVADDGRVSEQIDASLRDIAAARAPVHSALAEYAETLKDAQKTAQSAGPSQGQGQGQSKAKGKGQRKATSQGPSAGAADTGAGAQASGEASASEAPSDEPSASEAAAPADASRQASNPATLI